MRSELADAPYVLGVARATRRIEIWRRRSTPMTPEDRDLMIELVRRIARETDPKRLAVCINDLNELIQSKIRELRETRKTN